MELSINDIRELIGSVDNNANPNDVSENIYERCIA